MSKTKKDLPLTIKEINKQFISTVKKVAHSLDKLPHEVTKSQFLNSELNEISEWDIRKVGGFQNLKKMFFPAEENIEVKNGSRLINSHRNSLEKQ